MIEGSGSGLGDTDPEPRGPKTYGSDGSGSATLDTTRANSEFRHCGIQSDLPIEAAVSLYSEKSEVMFWPSTAVLLSHPCTQRGKFKYKAKTISQQTLCLGKGMLSQ